MAELVTKEPSVSFHQWQMKKEQAAILLASKILPPMYNTIEKVIVLGMYGEALGMKTVVAAQHIHMIQGKPTIAPRLMLARAIATGDMEDWKLERLEDRIRFTVKRKSNKSAHVEEFGDTEAKAMGLWGKDNYVKQKFTMYKWRAVSAGLNFIFPDVLMGGIYTPEELGASIVVSGSDDLDVKLVEQGPTDKAVDDVEAAKIRVQEILAGLGEIHAGNMEAMAEELKALTLHKEGDEEKWIELDELTALAITKPVWVDRLYAKIMPTIKERLK